MTEDSAEGSPARAAVRSAEPENLTPLHHQVYVVLRQQIAENVFTPDTPLPPEHDLSRQFGVSRITVRRALERLQAEGLITRHRGKGTFAKGAPTHPMVRAGMRGIFENLITMGLQTRVRLVEFGYTRVPAQVAAELGLPPCAEVQRAVRVRSHEDRPFAHLTTWLPADIGRTFTEAEMIDKPLLLLLERAGLTLSAADQSISAKLADPLVARLLNVEPGTALIWVRRTVRDQTDRAVEYLEALYRPDLYEYEMTLTRVGEGEGGLWQPA